MYCSTKLQYNKQYYLKGKSSQQREISQLGNISPEFSFSCASENDRLQLKTTKKYTYLTLPLPLEERYYKAIYIQLYLYFCHRQLRLLYLPYCPRYIYTVPTIHYTLSI